MGTFNSKLGEQLNICWSFISLECEVENRLSWITKIEPELMIQVSLALSIRQLQDGQNYLLSNSKISGFKNLEKRRIFAGNGIVSMSKFYSLTGKQMHWLQEILILMVDEIKSLAATEVPFSSSMTNCSTSRASYCELKLDGAWWDSEILQVRANKKFDGSTGLLDLDYFIFMLRVIDLRSRNKDGDSDGALFQSDGKTLRVYRMAFTKQVFPLFIKPTERWINF